MTSSNPKTFIVAYIDWFDYNLILERITASSWEDAVVQHSKYPFKDSETDAPNAVITDADAFKQECFDCDCMMSWIEVTS